MQEATSNISVARFAGAVAVTLIVLFAICWVAARLPFPSATHAYVGLFTTADPRSGAALIQGVLWSAVFGLLAGAIGAAAYNLFGRNRRG